uniref:Phage protein n=1 Tax=Klebsiella phage Phi_KR1 TaxID=3240396 RepID=A0AB39U0K5_9CAUD
MKRCELIRNVASAICLTAVGTSIFGAIFMGVKEIIVVLVAAFLMGIISFIMDKIAHEKD